MEFGGSITRFVTSWLVIATFVAVGCSSSNGGQQDTSVLTDVASFDQLPSDSLPQDQLPPGDERSDSFVPSDIAPLDLVDLFEVSDIDLSEALDIPDEADEASIDETDDTLPDNPLEDVALEFAYGEIQGTCGSLAAQLDSSEPSFFSNVYLFDDALQFNPAHLSSGAETRYNSDNAGGSSMCSEVMSIQVLEEGEGATLYKMETEVLYDIAGDITDYVVIINGEKVGVSVTRAYKGPFVDEYTPADATELLEKKLLSIQESSANVSAEDQWVKQILHIWTLHEEWRDTVATAWESIDPSIKGNTIVLVTVESNSELIVPDKCGLEGVPRAPALPATSRPSPAVRRRSFR